MVIEYRSTTVTPPAVIFMAENEKENEQMLKVEGFCNEVWFHVENAHACLQLPKRTTIDTIPEALLEDCCQLVKAKSIKGCKFDMVEVVYTTRDNLKKTKEMVAGQVGYRNSSLVRTHQTFKKNTDEIMERLEKSIWNPS